MEDTTRIPEHTNTTRMVTIHAKMTRIIPWAITTTSTSPRNTTQDFSPNITIEVQEEIFNDKLYSLVSYARKSLIFCKNW